MKFNVLVIDDEKNIREGLGTALEMDGYKVFLAADGNEGMEFVNRGDMDLVITDLRMPGLSGEEVLSRVSSQSPGLPVIVLTGHGSIETAVEAMRKGAYDFLTKPVNLDRLSLLAKRALETRELSLQHTVLKQEVEGKLSFENMIGKSPELQKVFDLVKRVAPSKASVLITGESGVGKEMIANALHNLSPRKNKPFIKVHCASLSENLLESELFGHEKGAFTGAIARKRGRFELAHEGTLFLDEIGEIDQNVQVKILRVIQEKKFERVGGEETIEVDVRIITATNRNLEEEIKKGNFREDLYYRLNVVNINVPPLRNRKEDIPVMMNNFMHEFAEENGKKIDSIDIRARNALFSYDWPGNVRELRNCMEGAVVMAQGNTIKLEDLPPGIVKSADNSFMRVPLGTSMEQIEKQVIQENLVANKGNKTKTALLLGIGRKTLHRKLEEYGITDQLQNEEETANDEEKTNQNETSDK